MCFYVVHERYILFNGDHLKRNQKLKNSSPPSPPLFSSSVRVCVGLLLLGVEEMKKIITWERQFAIPHIFTQ